MAHEAPTGPVPRGDAPALLAALEAAVGRGHVLRADGSDDLARFLVDWRGRYRGRALAVVRPADTAQVAQVIRLCGQAGVGIVPQGGNTSLVGGAVPDDSGRQIVLSLTRLNRVLHVDADNLSITVEAGCLLADVQQAAEAAGLLFPLSLASEGTCTIGGNLASNAGGTQVLRYGTARELCLGLEAVTARGEVWNGLHALRKDNTGFDLRDLLVGSEGTLGVITAAALRLYPRPKGQATALVSCPDMTAAVALLRRARDRLDAGLTAFEAMGQLPLQLVQRHHPDVATVASALARTGSGAKADALAEGLADPPADPLADPLAGWTVLLENVSCESDPHAQGRLQALLEDAWREGEITNASLAGNVHQRRQMWRLRETIPLAERAEGLMVKHDIGVPTSALPAFVDELGRAITGCWPGARIVCFGHLGDGNLHYNVQPPPGSGEGEALAAFERAVNQVVFDHVARFGGTLSAEHGIGVLRREELARRKSPVAMSMMRAIKQALDPQGLLNPGRVVGATGTDMADRPPLP